MNGLFLRYTKNKCSTKRLKVIVIKFHGLLIKSESELKKTTKQKKTKEKRINLIQFGRKEGYVLFIDALDTFTSM